MGSPVRRYVVSLAALSLMVVGVLAQPTSASTTTKKFTAAITPQCAGAGQLTDLRLTLVNKAKQQLGSVNLTPPPGFSLDASLPNPVVSPTGTATVNNSTNVLEIRNLSLLANATATIDFRATPAAGTEAGAYAWTAQGKQSNDFNGSPGNDFVPVTDIVTYVNCRLAVVRQPADAEKNANITSVRFSPTGPAVQVEVLQPTANAVVSTSTDPITLALDPSAHPTAALSPASPGNTVSAVAGVATFFASGPDLTIDTSGTYTLSATNPRMVTTQTSLFTIYDDVADCRRNQACPEVSASDSGTTVNVHANAASTPGFAFAAMDAEASFDCGSYIPVSGTATFGASTDRSKTVILTVNKALAPSRAVSQYQFCYSSDFDPDGDGVVFYDRSGSPVAPGAAGLLPDCSKNVPTPCLDSVQGGSTTVTLTALVPAGATRGRT
jgi:hypothetical protein